MQGAFGDDQLGLVDDGRGDPQRAVQQRRGQWNAGRAPDEEHAGDVLRWNAGGAQHGPGQLRGAVQVDARGTLELVPGQVDRPVDQRQVQIAAGMPGQLLLHGPGTGPQAVPGQLVGGGLRPVQPLPGRGVVAGDGAGVADHRGVQVQAADVGQAVGGDDLEAAGRRTDHADVEGAGAEVIHHDRRAGTDPVLRDRGEIPGRGDGLGDEPHRPQLRPVRGLRQDAQPLPLPRRGVGQHDLVGAAARDPAGLRTDPGQHGGDELGDRDLPLAEPDGAVVDPPLRVGLQPGGRPDRGAQRVRADEKPAACGGEDRRRQQRRAVEQQRADPPVRGGQCRDGVGRAEIDPEPVPSRSHECHCMAPGPARRPSDRPVRSRCPPDGNRLRRRRHHGRRRSVTAGVAAGSDRLARAGRRGPRRVPAPANHVHAAGRAPDGPAMPGRVGCPCVPPGRSRMLLGVDGRCGHGYPVVRAPNAR
ncbi:hypothetical protein OHA72_58135 [Dactylosporangium sp. NBC_01737]|nr:hypothetical protein OHA72_58135 [Dactylosporangium sp. NBC_01737]